MPHHIRKQIRHPHSKEIEGSMSNVSGWANTSCRFDFSQERSLCLSYVYVQW